MTLALSTGGASPAYARHLREELEVWLHEHEPLAALLGRIRPRLLALERDTMQNTELFRALVQSGLGAALVAGDGKQCGELLAAALPEDLRPWIAEFLDGLV
jgi:precorrin-2 dehydrogenase/sirohydrochlorin ferrochelatase